MLFKSFVETVLFFVPFYFFVCLYEYRFKLEETLLNLMAKPDPVGAFPMGL